MLNFNRSNTVVWVLGFLMLFISASSAHAQDANRLTEQSVRAFLDESISIYKKPYPEFLAFIEKTTHDDFDGQIVMTVHKGNEAPVQAPVSMDKQMILSTAREGYGDMKDAVITTDIHEIKISPDKKSATVKSTLSIKNQRIPAPEGSNITILGDSITQCHDEIVFTPGNGIQSFRARYVSDLTIKQEQEL
jgi:hypothetical protein